MLLYEHRTLLPVINVAMRPVSPPLYSAEISASIICRCCSFAGIKPNSPTTIRLIIPWSSLPTPNPGEDATRV